MKDMVRYSRLLSFYSGILTKKQNDVLELYYGSDLTMEEIAENCGVTKQAVHYSIKNAEEKINGLEEKLKLLNRQDDTQEKLARVLELMEKKAYDEAREMLKRITEDL